MNGLLSLPTLTLLSEPTLAADRSWSNTAGGNFSTSTNWQNGLLPGVNDVANFSNSSVFFPPGLATYTITFNANAQTQAVRVKNDFVTFDLTNRTFTTTAITGNEVGSVGGAGTILTARNARLTITGGVFNFNSVLPAQMLIGAVPGGVGSLTVTNGGSIVGSPRLFVGTPSATGFFNLPLGGGTVTTSLFDLGSGAGGHGTAVITGPFSQLTTGSLLVGNAGAGTMTVDTGGTFLNNGAAVIGNLTGSAGNITLDGATARWIQTGSMVIGSSGAGTVNVTGGGSLNAVGQNVTVGSNAGSIGRLFLSGNSSRARVEQLVVGKDGIGIMHVSGGASISSSTSTSNIVSDTGNGFVDISSGGAWFSGNGSATIANQLNAVGRVDVRGFASRWTTNSLIVGNRGNGALNITDAASVSTSGGATIGSNSSGSGTVSVDGVGSIWNIFSGSLSVGRNGTGHMQITNGGRVQSLDSTIGVSSSVLVQGQDSTWVTDDLEVTGSAGNFGTLVVNSGGIVDSHRGQVGPVIGGTGAATFSGAGTQWRIATTLSVGDNAFNTTGSVGTLTIENGATVDVIQSVIVGDNGTIILNGGTLRSSNLTLDSTAAFQFDAGLLRITGNPNLTDPFLDRLFGLTHTLAAGRHLSIGGTPTLTAPLVLDGGILTIPTLAVGSPLQFDGGTLNLTSANLTVGAGGLLGSSITLDDRSINVTNATTIQPSGQLVFAGGSFTSGGGLINLGEIQVVTGASANFFNSVTGAGSFTGGGTKVFQPGSTSSVGAIDSPGTTTVESGATLTAARIREQSLTVGGSMNIIPGGTDASTSRLNALSITGGRLDLADNALIIDYIGTSPLTQIAVLSQTGFAGGSWNGAGINSSIAAATPNRALGFAEASALFSSFPATFAGQPVDETSVLIRFTLPGDADMSGGVNLNDFTRLAAAFGASSTWASGDFNYDGVTNLDDFTALAANFGLTLADMPARSVPEPVAAAALTIVAAHVSRRRRT